MSAPLGSENVPGFTGPLRYFTLHYIRVCHSLICTYILPFLKVISRYTLEFCAFTGL